MKKYESRVQEEKDDRPVTLFYSQILDCKEMGIPLLEFKKLSRLDRKILKYYRIMERYYFDFSPQQIKLRDQMRKNEQKRKESELMGLMPKLNIPSRGRGR